MTDLAVRDEQSLALAADAAYWNETQLATLRQIGLEGAGDGDLRVFHHVSQRTGLDPFARQIYMIKRDGKWTIQTGIDGFRLVARRAVDRSAEAYSIGEPLWCGPDGLWREVWLDDAPPAAARVVITRGSGTFVGIALWREYAQWTNSNGVERLTRMWNQRGAGQLAKCAEALGLRKAFPQDLAGIYTDDEMAASQIVQGEVIEQAPATAADLVGEPPSEPQRVQATVMVSQAQLKKIGAAMRELSMTDRKVALAYVADVIERPIETRNDLSKDEAHKVIEALEADLKGQQEPPPDAEDEVAKNDPALDEQAVQS